MVETLSGGVSIDMPYSSSEEIQIFDYTNIAGYVFDAWLKIREDSRLEVTQHPVQTGAAISDHSFLLPKECEFDILMTDCAKSMIAGQFTEEESRSKSAYEVLKKLQASRVPLNIVTRLNQYENMLIVDMPSEDDYKTLTGLRITVKCQQILMAEVKTVKLSARSQVTDKTNIGNKTAQQPLESVLYKIAHGTLF